MPNQVFPKVFFRIFRCHCHPGLSRSFSFSSFWTRANIFHLPPSLSLSPVMPLMILFFVISLFIIVITLLGFASLESILLLRFNNMWCAVGHPICTYAPPPPPHVLMLTSLTVLVTCELNLTQCTQHGRCRMRSLILSQFLISPSKKTAFTTFTLCVE